MSSLSTASYTRLISHGSEYCRGWMGRHKAGDITLPSPDGDGEMGMGGGPPGSGVAGVVGVMGAASITLCSRFISA